MPKRTKPVTRTDWCLDPRSGCWLRASLRAQAMLVPTDEGWAVDVESWGHRILDTDCETLEEAKAEADKALAGA
jgi:hypothetical protein